MAKLVCRNNTTMPTRCAKCGMADAREARLEDYRYRPLWARPLGTLGALFDRQASFCFWLCPGCNARWKWSAPLSILAFVLGIAGWLVGARFLLPFLLGFVSGPASIVIGLGYFLSFIPWLYVLDFLVDVLVHERFVVSVRGIAKDGMVTLHGVHPDVVSAISV